MKAKHLFSFKLLMVLTLFTIAVSCKKERAENPRPKTLADFEKIMTTDLNLIEFRNATKAIYREANGYNVQWSITKTQSTDTKVKALTGDEERAFKAKPQTRPEIMAFLNAHQKGNSEEIIRLAEVQFKAIASFAKNYPEFQSLKEDEKTALIVNYLKAPTLANTTKNSSSGVTTMADPCYTSWTQAQEDCEDQYNWETAFAFVGVVGGVIATEGMGLLIVTDTWMATQALILAHWFSCSDKASTRFYSCLGM